MNTDCLNDSEFINWQSYNFHVKIWNNERIEKFIYSAHDKKTVIDNIKDEYLNCRIISIRKGEVTYPELHQRVLEHNKK